MKNSSQGQKLINKIKIKFILMFWAFKKEVIPHPKNLSNKQ